MINFKLLHPEMTEEHLGFLPLFLAPSDPRRATEQLDSAYQHGGGWDPFKGFTLQSDNSLTYRGDPPLQPLAQAKLRDETIVFYSGSWVAVIQPDRSFEVSRMDLNFRA